MIISTKHTISEAATLYKKSRATIYKDIKNGDLSRNNDGSIEFSELLRVYGEPFNSKSKKRINTSSIQDDNTNEYIVENNADTQQDLKNQIAFLKRLLEKAEDREEKANQRIDTLLTLIEMKKTTEDEHKQPDEKVIKKEENRAESSALEDPPIKQNPVAEVKQKQPKKRGFWSRLLLPDD